MTHRNNLFSLPDPLPEEEFFEDLVPDSSVRIERIISTGHVTPPGVWLKEESDEWVSLLQGSAVIEYEEGRKVELELGDWILIPAHTRHRVGSTTADPPCVWLAVHGKLRN